MSIAAVETRPVRLNIAQRLAPPAERPVLQLRSTQDDKKKILFVTSEMTDLVKTGGLADVTAALTAYLDARGHDVRMLMPFYSKMDKTKPVPERVTK